MLKRFINAAGGVEKNSDHVETVAVTTRAKNIFTQ
jgi:hypothetical protein